MSWYEITIGVIMFLLSAAIIGLVLLQQSREAGLSGVIAGGADTFFGKNKSRTRDAKYAKWTKILAVVMFVLTLFASFLFAFLAAR